MKKFFTLMFLALMAVSFSGCNKQPTALFSYTTQTHADYTAVAFTNLSVDAEEYSWDFGDGERSTATSPSHKYYYSGKYKVTLIAYGKKGTVSKYSEEITISINGENPGGNPDGNPTASFNINSSNGYYAPTTIYCNNTSTNATHYQWTLIKPDYTSSTSTNREPSFTCTQAGTYTLRLIAYNANDISSTSEQSFTLVAPSTVKITYLKLQRIPMLAPDNSSWDTGLLGGADPDIYFKILTSSNSLLYTSGVGNDISSSDFPITWNSVNTTLDYGPNYYVKFYDQDGSLDDDDLMRSCILNTTYMTPGSSTYTWENTDGTVKFTIGLQWN